MNFCLKVIFLFSLFIFSAFGEGTACRDFNPLKDRTVPGNITVTGTVVNGSAFTFEKYGNFSYRTKKLLRANDVVRFTATGWRMNQNRILRVSVHGNNFTEAVLVSPIQGILRSYNNQSFHKQMVSSQGDLTIPRFNQTTFFGFKDSVESITVTLRWIQTIGTMQAYVTIKIESVGWNDGTTICKQFCTTNIQQYRIQQQLKHGSYYCWESLMSISLIAVFTVSLMVLS